MRSFLRALARLADARSWIGLFALAAIASSSQAQTPPCMTDRDGNGVVDIGDMSIVLLEFGPCVDCGSDLDASGVVDFADLSVTLLDFGACAGPAWGTVLEWAPDPAIVYDEQLRSDIAATHLPWRVRDDRTGIEVLLIPPGTMQMGCSRSIWYECLADEQPMHQVTISNPFYFGRYEVTQAQWTAVMRSNPSHFNDRQESPVHPVDTVTWTQALQFGVETGFRMPTEAEWELACRAGSRAPFHGVVTTPGGTDVDSYLHSICWFGANAEGGTRPVGRKLANGFGLHDMLGNVQEWVQDWYGEFPSESQVDPVGPATGVYRVNRGGSWFNWYDAQRASRRIHDWPDARNICFGLRVARTP